MPDAPLPAPEKSPALLIEQQQYAEAIELLKSINYNNADGEHLAMLGLAYFHTEQYSLSAANFEKALKFDPSNKEWLELWLHAKGNAVSEVDVAIPEVYYFDREKLLSKPEIPKSALPETLAVAASPCLCRHLIFSHHFDEAGEQVEKRCCC